MTVNNPDELMHAVLPPALEVLTAWSIAETDGDPSVFRRAMDRTIGDAAHSEEPLRGSGPDDVRAVLAVRHPARRASPRPQVAATARYSRRFTTATSIQTAREDGSW
ncbi:MAG: hypothetical protein ACRDTT_12625 [Pseudonocardiaceae bacterium]